MNSIDETIKQLRRVQENIQKVEGTHTYSFKEIFNDDFVSSHTRYSNISDFLEHSGLDFSSQEAFQNIDIEKLDKYISKNSDFSSWEEMKITAAKLITEKQILS